MELRKRIFSIDVLPTQKYRAYAGIAKIMRVEDGIVIADTTWAGVKSYTLSEIVPIIEKGDWRLME